MQIKMIIVENTENARVTLLLFTSDLYFIFSFLLIGINTLFSIDVISGFNIYAKKTPIIIGLKIYIILLKNLTNVSPLKRIK